MHETQLEYHSSHNPCGKVPYRDKKAARTKANQILSSRRKHRPKKLREYFCPDCHKWHLSQDRD